MDGTPSPNSRRAEPDRRKGRSLASLLLITLAALVGLALLIDGVGRSSATYDEVKYLEIGSRWWRTGDQEEISRMGSPLTFWKLQQVPVLWALDALGRGHWIDDPIRYQALMLPWLRLGSLWIWLIAFLVTTVWSRGLNGPLGGVVAAWWFALSPNLLAHGGLITMELPLVAAWSMCCLAFWRFLETGDRRWFLASGAAAGLAFSCKFTTILLPPLLGVAWLIHLTPASAPDAPTPKPVSRRMKSLLRKAMQVAIGMAAFLGLLILTDLLITGFAAIPPSPRTGSHPSLDGRWGQPWDQLVRLVVEAPWPQDWVGLANQIRHQKSGGWSYLLGERRQHGWRSYYFIALGVKTPLSLGLALLARLACRSCGREQPEASRFLLIIMIGFMLATALGSSRNYGVRYLLPLAPLAIVWISGLARGGWWSRMVLCLGMAGQAIAVGTSHPHELAYFNGLAGGAKGGRAILADSNLDWGQGARDLARLQSTAPEFQDMTLYYFGDTSPGHYGVLGRVYVIDAHDDHPQLPDKLSVSTRYLAVSASLQYGPWGPAGYFDRLKGVAPVALLPDASIAIYRADDIPRDSP